MTIAASGLISIILATAWVDFGAIELGAIIYFIMPLLIGLGTLILFWLTDKFIVQKRVWLTIAFIGVNILTGLFMRLDFYYNFINW